MFALNPRLATWLATLLFFTFSACEKDELYPTTELGDTNNLTTKSVASATPSELPPKVQLVYEQFAPLLGPDLVDAFHHRLGQPLWERAIVSSAPYLLVGYTLDSTQVGPTLLPETVILPFAKKGAVTGILISEFEPDGSEIRQKYISRTLHQLMQQYSPASYSFNRVASYAFTYFDNYDGSFDTAGFSGDCPSECGCQILPNTGLCGISEALISGPHVPANTWAIEVPCPCSGDGPGDTGGGNDDGTGDPNPGDGGGGGFDGPINVGGVNVPGWYVPYYIDAINWTSRRPGSGGFQVNILSLEELLNRGDRNPNDDHSFGGGGELHDTPIFQNCLDNAFPPTDGEQGSSAGGDGLGGSEALWALLTDMFGQSADVINSINAIDSHIRSQTGAPASQPALTQNQWRYLILHPSEAADIAHALTTDQTTPATVSAYLTLKSTFDSCNSLPGLNFDLLTEEPGVFNALANHLATNPTNTEAMQAVNRVLALHECIGLNAGLVPHVLGNEEMLNFFYGELAAGACGEAGFQEAALNVIGLSVYCGLAIDDFEVNFGINLSLADQMTLFAPGNAAPPPCGNQEAFNLWILENAPLAITLRVDDERLNSCELALLFTEHITCISSLRKNRAAAFSTAGNFFGGVGGANGCGDAFRHAFFNALNARDCGIETARAWGLAHECDETSNASHMDLYNNEVGYYFGIEGKSDEEIATSICEVLSRGYLRVLSDVTNENSEIVQSNACSCD